jgi:hydroxyacylglutathione hydrolase
VNAVGKTFSFMLLERIYDDDLAQASYLVACQETGSAIIVDPNRDIAQYIGAVERRSLRLEYVTETHIHADFVSGARDLARETGATLLLSGEGGPDWRYAFARSDGARVLEHRDCFDVGQVRFEVRHTPGHTPEHLSFIVTDRLASERPVGMFSGDFIFVGDVGRPDLLERAANSQGTMDTLARQLFRSLRATSELPDFLQLWPGHGEGSACGKALGAMPSSTLGYERLVNWAFQIGDEDTFVREVLNGQPEPPKYFATMKSVNRDGPAPSPKPNDLPELDLTGFERARSDGASIVDVRATADFAAGHIPSTLNIPVGTSFATWAGSLLPYERDIVLLADTPDRIERARRLLMLVGHDRVVARGGRALRDEWQHSHGALARVKLIESTELPADDGRVIIDVRGQTEWDAGHMPQARHLFLGNLSELARDIPHDTPLAVHCQGGTRSAIAASVLQAQGFTDVANVTGGFRAWEAAGLPVGTTGEAGNGTDSLHPNRTVHAS